MVERGWVIYQKNETGTKPTQVIHKDFLQNSLSLLFFPKQGLVFTFDRYIRQKWQKNSNQPPLESDSTPVLMLYTANLGEV